MANPFFSGRIPHELFDAVEKYRQSTGESKTDVLVKALSTYIGTPIKSQEPQADRTGDKDTEKLRNLEVRVEALEKLVTETKAVQASPQVETIDHGQMSLDDIGVPAEDKEIPKHTQDDCNKSDNRFDNKADNKQQEETELDEKPDNKIDNSTDNEEGQQVNRIFVGAIKTEEIPVLPGLEGEDPKKIKIKLNNTRNTKAKKTQIGCYIINLSSNVEEPAKGKKKELLWDVYRLQDA